MKDTEHTASDGSVRLFWAPMTGLFPRPASFCGVAAAGASSGSIAIAGVAGLVAGAMQMAAGEYVSVSSQADTERADLDREGNELSADPEHEHAVGALFGVAA